MARIVDLRPSYQLRQCSTDLSDMLSHESQFYSDYRTKRAQRNGRDPQRCQKSAKYCIDGDDLCAFHAGIRAIEILKATGGA